MGEVIDLHVLCGCTANYGTNKFLYYIAKMWLERSVAVGKILMKLERSDLDSPLEYSLDGIGLVDSG